MNKWEIYTNQDLDKLLRDAIEMRNKRWLKAIKAEITRRNSEQWEQLILKENFTSKLMNV